MDSNSSSYSSSGSSTSSLSSPRVPITDMVQQEQLLRIPSSTTTQSHVCVTRYKTELCRPFTETGKCKYGDKCQFSHGMKELRLLMRHPKYKTEYCRTFHTSKQEICSQSFNFFSNYIAGYCPYGPRCHFIHDMHEARTAINANDSTLRRHSDVRTNQSIQKSTTRYLFNITLPQTFFFIIEIVFIVIIPNIQINLIIHQDFLFHLKNFIKHYFLTIMILMTVSNNNNRLIHLFYLRYQIHLHVVHFHHHHRVAV
jgi:hypothetical protein